MANKGLDVVLDVPAINEIIVFANHYRQGVTASADTIRTLCAQMQDNESLAGGDGEEIRENFKIIGEGCTQLEQSVEKIVTVLNNRLETMLQMNKGKISGDSKDTAKKAAGDMRIIKE